MEHDAFELKKKVADIDNYLITDKIIGKEKFKEIRSKSKIYSWEFEGLRVHF